MYALSGIHNSELDFTDSALSEHSPLIAHSAYVKIDCPICKVKVIKINEASRINIRHCCGV